MTAEGLPPGGQIPLLPEQVGISGPWEIRTLLAHPPVVSLQAGGQSGNDEEEKKKTSHGSNPAARGFLPTVAGMSSYERKLPSQTADRELAFSATFCLHSSGTR
jgi:hypothetical protein